MSPEDAVDVVDTALGADSVVEAVAMMPADYLASLPRLDLAQLLVAALVRAAQAQGKPGHATE